MRLRMDEGSVLLWLIIALVMAMILGMVVFAVVQGDGGKASAPPAPRTDEDHAVGENTSQPEAEKPEVREEETEGRSDPAKPVEEGGPAGNDRSPAVTVSPPIESGQEAFAATLQLPEVRDWYWSVDQPRYQAQDQGGYYLVKLYTLLPAEGALPERSATFGDYRVVKSDGSVSRVK